MVALAGPGWRLAPSLVVYVEEADRYYPSRDRTSDGSIGDQAHASRESDHNPYDGWVHAVDLDEDLAPGLDLKRMAEKLRQEILADIADRRPPRIRYLIYEGRVCKAYLSNGVAPGKWQPYTGENAHLHHLHLSIDRTERARRDYRPWGFKPTVAAPKPAPREDDDMRKIVKGDGTGVTAAVAARWFITDGIQKRHVNDRAEAAGLVYVGLAEWGDGEPFVWPQALVDDIVTVKAA